MDEEVQATQNTEKETLDTDQSQVGTETTSTDQGVEPAGAEAEVKEEKKEKDFEQGLYKWRTRAKELETELRELKQTQVTAPPVTAEATKTDEEEAVNILKGIVGDVLKEEIAPIKTQFEAQARDKAIEEIGSRPFAKGFAEEIVETAKALPSDMSFSERLDRAYKDFMSSPDTLVKIAGTNRQVGMDAAYDNQSVKRGQQGLGDTPTKTTETKGLLERFEAGELSPEEYKENRVELEKLRKEQLGIN
jgi:hypothetical protein